MVTLEAYLRQRFPGLYLAGAPALRLAMAGDTIAIPSSTTEVSPDES